MLPIFTAISDCCSRLASSRRLSTCRQRIYILDALLLPPTTVFPFLPPIYSLSAE